MAILEKQQRKRARKGTAHMRAKPRPGRTGSRVGDDLVEAFEQMAAHLRGEIELESYPVLDTNSARLSVRMLKWG